MVKRRSLHRRTHKVFFISVCWMKEQQYTNRQSHSNLAPQIHLVPIVISIHFILKSNLHSPEAVTDRCQTNPGIRQFLAVPWYYAVIYLSFLLAAASLADSNAAISLRGILKQSASVHCHFWGSSTNDWHHKWRSRRLFKSRSRRKVKLWGRVCY